MSQVQDIVKDLIIRSLGRIDSQTCSVVRLLHVKSSLVSRVVAVAQVVLLPMLGRVILLHLDLIQEVFSGVVALIGRCAQTTS